MDNVWKFNKKNHQKKFQVLKSKNPIVYIF